MGKRYYCDFCDKTIPNNHDMIKKHNEGAQHQTLKNSYYLKYKDLETKLYEERQKRPCFKYFNLGFCTFGDLCRDSHKNKEQIQQMEDLYRLECHKKVKLEEEKLERSNKSLRKKNYGPKEYLTEYLNREENEKLENFFPKYNLPKKLAIYNESVLPPSLKSPTYKDFINYEPNSWTDDSN
ncbi:unnamed protein product [Brachionus calyciflorus]|uniref:C3H1-type domain-containing protein n=1 Tax=Brachionus calyciflorus TaxID=104777 RepID=A0A813RCC9_9BILA|nr:unnamed protein product [Brachionus calyciflorus]